MTSLGRASLGVLLARLVLASPAAAPQSPAATPAPPAYGGAPIASSAAAPAGEMVAFQAGGEKVRGYLVRPTLHGHRPAVVVVHEWWGLNTQIKGVADRLAELGFLTVVPDLYGGKVADEPGLAHELMRGLNEDRAVTIIKGAIDYLKHYDRAKDRNVGTLGFCMGGGYSLQAALRGADVKATVMFYGSVQTTRESVLPLRAPLLGIFGAQDRGIPVGEVRKFEAALREAHKKSLIAVYPGVGHAFMNETGPGYDKETADKAWTRATKFLIEALRPEPKAPGPVKRAPSGGPSGS
ncbi:MAG TPA: dienelactone hydrolase family protein [Candidatus Polarisedimenticolia bacterium]|nr:dienelactone hydrolase family protein [Candidatus Polarisedimenticolia bacterium]